jgi:hypothetical protein
VASTITIAATANWALPLLEMQPLEILGMEPALSSANLVLQTILGPPMAWPFNRSIASYTSAAQDVQLSLPDYGFLEGGTVQPSTGTGQLPWSLKVKNYLDTDQSATRPEHISPLLDDGMGNITFRLHPAPEQSYNVLGIYQRRAPQLQSMGYTWAPVPDERAYIYEWGFLALMSLIGNDARFNVYNSKFITSILGAQGGLTEMERNIFLANWTRVMSQLQATQLETAERYRAREQ